MNNFLDNLTSTQRKLVMAIMAIIVYVVSTTAAYSIFAPVVSNNPSSSSSQTAQLPGSTGMVEEDPNLPRNNECVINGTKQTDNAKKYWDTRRPLAVMIENHQESRPQSGLSSADVVYEAVAEGGITRFMAVSTVGETLSSMIFKLVQLDQLGLISSIGCLNTMLCMLMLVVLIPLVQPMLWGKLLTTRSKI